MIDPPMLTDSIALDKLIGDIDAQLEILNAIAQDSSILTEQWRLLHESREAIIGLQLETARLAELIDPDDDRSNLTIIERHQLGDDAPD